MADEAPPLTLFPIYLYEHGFELPKKGTYYVVTKSGIYIHKETKAGNALVPVKGIPWLKEPDMEFRLKLPKIPGLIIGQALTFFRKVFAQHKSEAYVTLFYSQKLNQYRLWCPVQEVSPGSVAYDRNDQMAFEERKQDDWQMCGTIHSHCDFSAFHSGTDTGDEATFDGIHITLGHVNREQFSMVSSIAINDQRETLDPTGCTTGVVAVPSAPKTTFGFAWSSEKDTFFDLELSEEDAQALVAATEMIDSEWMPKVTKKVYVAQQWSGGHWDGFAWQSKKNDDGGSEGIDTFPDDYNFGDDDENWLHRRGHGPHKP